MKQLKISILTYIDVTIKELDITTTALIDIGSEATFFQDFLLPKWESSLMIVKLESKVFIIFLPIWIWSKTMFHHFRQQNSHYTHGFTI